MTAAPSDVLVVPAEVLESYRKHYEDALDKGTIPLKLDDFLYKIQKDKFEPTASSLRPNGYKPASMH
ncbi:MAG: hypothetical protein HY362_02830 [Candidatus Aenigmarchaeota archaeon]|nr:hypothetical protein [Candidatus Aenigmarchaeota archaeon]